MALVPVEPAPSPPPVAEPERLDPPPPVVVTPCDPWPRPYYIENGLRRVTPYFYTYNTNCKGRWRDREVFDIFSAEFRDRPAEYYRNAIETGNVRVNGNEVSTTTIVRNGDVISHTCHRHEPPVTAQPVGIVHEDDGIIVINKPAGVPVHPAGRYHYNSIVEIMRAERGYHFNPAPCNRLDRLTSGIMFIGKNREDSERLSRQIRQRDVKKEYVARVVGEFPDGEVVCEQPVLTISPKLGLNRVRANGKDARTVFKRLAYYPPKEDGSPANGSRGDGEAPASPPDDRLPWRRSRGHSIVRCLPLTGRTHQLRVHLQFLGHPITNDPIYSNQRVFGYDLGEGDTTADGDDDIISRLSKMGKSEVAEAVAYHDEMVEQYNQRKAERETGQVCDLCDTPLYSDPGVHELGIYLHAKRYRCESGGWDYETPLPDWAKPPPGMAGPTEATPDTDPLATDLGRLGLEEKDTA